MKTTHTILNGIVTALTMTGLALSLHGRGGMPEAERENIHGLFGAHDQIEREVSETDDGYTSRTTSSDPKVVQLLQSHVKQMETRLKSGLMVRRWDPAYAEFVSHYDDIDIKFTNIENGISVTATGKTDAARKVARNHAGIISKFVANGWNEHDKTHAAVLVEGAAEENAKAKKCSDCAKEKAPAGCPHCTKPQADKAAPETGSLTDTQREELTARGNEVTMTLMKTLSTQLKAALESGNPASAVQVCKQVATPVTGATADLFEGLDIRRTTLKVRNPQNAADRVDEDLLNRWQDLLDSGQVLPDHELVVDKQGPRFYKPLVAKAVCIQCHGEEKNLDGELRQQLARLYPDDKARGYAEGDLRGAVVVEFKTDDPPLGAPACEACPSPQKCEVGAK